MASRSNPREASHQEAPDMASTQNAVADITRQQLANTAQTASALLRALDSFQQTQQQMLQRAAQLQSQTAERLRNARSPTELMAVQSSLMLSSLTEIAQYTQELLLASLKAQNELMRPTEEQQAGMAQAANAGAVPLFQAWQSVFSAPMNAAYAAAGAGSGTRHH